MVVAVLNALANKDFYKVWNCWIVLLVVFQRARFDCLFFPVGEGPVYLLQISLLRVGC